MEPLIACIMLGMISGLILPKWSARPFEKPRTTLLVVGTVALLGAMAYRGLQVHLDPFICVTVLVMFAYWALVSGTSIRPKISWQHMVKFTAAVVFGLFLITPEWRPALVQISLAMAVLHSVVAIMQSVFKKVPFEGLCRFKPFYACGLLTRSPNILGPYLVPHFFLAAWLASISSSLWLLSWIPMGWALWQTKCRAALLGTAAGAVFLGVVVEPFWTGLLLGTGALAIMVDGKRRRFLIGRVDTISDRMRYWRVAMAGMEEMPFVGYGFDVIKVRVPFLQRKLNEETGGKFLEGYVDPKPQKMHNDLLQTLMDTGPIGAALVFGLVAMAVASGLINHQWFHTAALVGLLVNGLFFHTFYFVPINMLFWYLVGALLQTPAPLFVLEPTVFFWMALGTFAYLSWRYTIREQWNDYLRWVAVTSTEADRRDEYLMKAMKLHPASSRVAVWAANVWQSEGRYFEVVQVLTRAIYSYDGIATLWYLWAHLSLAYIYAGAPAMAHQAAEESLRFYPGFPLAQQRKEMAENVLNRMKAEMQQEAA